MLAFKADYYLCIIYQEVNGVHFFCDKLCSFIVIVIVCVDFLVDKCKLLSVVLGRRTVAIRSYSGLQCVFIQSKAPIKSKCFFLNDCDSKSFGRYTSYFSVALTCRPDT